MVFLAEIRRGAFEGRSLDRPIGKGISVCEIGYVETVACVGGLGEGDGGDYNEAVDGVVRVAVASSKVWRS
jgi:hypothetical protein